MRNARKFNLEQRRARHARYDTAQSKSAKRKLRDLAIRPFLAYNLPMISRSLALVWMVCTATVVTADTGDLVHMGDLWRYHKAPNKDAKPDALWHNAQFNDSRWRF